MKQLEWKGIGKTNLGKKPFLFSDFNKISNFIFGNRFLMQILVKGKGSPFKRNRMVSATENRFRIKGS